jgi:hypothetical protein
MIWNEWLFFPIPINSFCVGIMFINWYYHEVWIRGHWIKFYPCFKMKKFMKKHIMLYELIDVPNESIDEP